MAALMGANIIKVKPPTAELDLAAAKAAYERPRTSTARRSRPRVRHVMQCCFAGKRLVVFSGGEAKDTEGLLDEIRQIRGRRRPRLDHRPQQLPAAQGSRRWSCWTR